MLGVSRIRRAIRRAAPKVVLALAATLMALGAGELAVRLLRLAPEVKSIATSLPDCVYERSSNPLLSYVLKANYRCSHPDLLAQYESTNAHGQRDRERTIARPSGVRRVLLLGDSVVEGVGIRETKTISRQLEGLFPEGDTEVLNFGVSGYCTLSEVELLKIKGLKFQPDVVVLLFVENDFQNFNREAFVLGAIPRPKIVTSLFLHCHLFRLAALRWNLWHFGAEGDPEKWNHEALGDNNVVEGLRVFAELSRQHGFTPLVAIWPHFTDDAIVNLPHMHIPDGSNELIVERLARMNGLPTVRLSEPFAQDAAANPGSVNPNSKYTIGDEIHPSAEGCRVAARVLKDHLARLPSGAAATSTAADGRQPGSEDEEAVKAAQAVAAGVKEATKSEVYNNIAARLLNAGQFEQAMKYVELALREDHSNAEAHVNRGNALAGMGRFADALPEYEEAVRINPNLAKAHSNWGKALSALGRRDDAVPHFKEAVRISPDLAATQCDWGDVLLGAGRPGDALPHYERAIYLNPQMALAHNNCAIALERLGRFDEAIAHYQDAVRLMPGSIEPCYNLGKLLQRQGRVAEAIAYYRRVLELKPGDADTLAALEQATRASTTTRSP